MGVVPYCMAEWYLWAKPPSLLDCVAQPCLAQGASFDPHNCLPEGDNVPISLLKKLRG